MGRGRSPAIAALAPILGVVAAAAASCALPLYEVGGTGASSGPGGIGGGGPGSGGRGGAGDQGGASVSGSSHAAVSVSASSGVGTGGAASCNNPTKATLTVADTLDNPRGIVSTNADLFWIEGPGKVMTVAKGGGTPLNVGTIDDACGLAAGNNSAQGDDQLVVHRRNGEIDYFFLKSLATSHVLRMASGPGYPDERSCSISVGDNAKSVWWFEQSGGTYIVATKQVGGTSTTSYAMVGAPAALDARDRDRVAWIDLAEMNAFAQPKTTGVPVAMTTPFTLTGLCAVGASAGRWITTQADEPFMWSWTPGDGVNGATLFKNVTSGYLPGPIDCASSEQFWVETDGRGCSNVRGVTSMSSPVELIGDEQPRVCSITVASDGGVYWTLCEASPLGAVVFAPP